MRLPSGRGAFVAFTSSLVITALVLTLVLNVTGDGDARHTISHHFPTDYVGPVWVTIDVPAGDAEMVLRWGRWARRVPYTGPGRRTYTFTKTSVDLDEGVPVIIESRHRLDAVFGYGLIRPVGSLVINDGWTPNESTTLAD